MRLDDRFDLARASRAARARDGVRVQGLERRRRGGVGRALLHPRVIRGPRGRRHRPRGVLRLHGRQAHGQAGRGQHPRDRVAGELVLRCAGARRGGRSRDAPGRGAVAALAALHRGGGHGGARPRRAHGDHARRAARGRAAQPPGGDHRESRRTRRSTSGSASSRPVYEGPTGIVGLLQQACADAGLPAVSLWASVPHYVAAAPNPKVALALVRAFEGTAGLAVDGAELESAADDYERQVTAAVASDPEVKAFVERLETAAGRGRPRRTRPTRASSPLQTRLQAISSGFLRQRGPGGPGQAS